MSIICCLWMSCSLNTQRIFWRKVSGGGGGVSGEWGDEWRVVGEGGGLLVS